MVRSGGPAHNAPAEGIPARHTLMPAGRCDNLGMENLLGSSIRAWRDRVDPAELGLAGTKSRRAPGLRREEVAAQAGISVNYLVRLEQGHATAPSLSVIAALGRALRLDRQEAAHLHRLAGYADACSRTASRHLTPSVQRIIDRLHDVPMIVLDSGWTVVAANPLASALLGLDPSGQNVARVQFASNGWVEHDPADSAAFEQELAADLRLRIALHPDDIALHSLVDELRATSERFAALWATTPARASAASRKTIHHPTAGRITVDCDVLEVVGSDLRLVVWSATPGSPDASALAVLGVVGMQRFES